MTAPGHKPRAQRRDDGIHAWLGDGTRGDLLGHAATMRRHPPSSCRHHVLLSRRRCRRSISGGGARDVRGGGARGDPEAAAGRLNPTEAGERVSGVSRRGLSGGFRR
jgi:hypothetical protein